VPVTAIVPHLTLIGTGYAELPQNGRRYRFQIERYRDDEGSEFGRIVSMEEVPDVGPYMWIPSYGVEAAEAEYMFGEWQQEQKSPNLDDAVYLAEHRYKQAQRMNNYNELRDERAKRLRGKK